MTLKSIVGLIWLFKNFNELFNGGFVDPVDIKYLEFKIISCKEAEKLFAADVDWLPNFFEYLLIILYGKNKINEKKIRYKVSLKFK